MSNQFSNLSSRLAIAGGLTYPDAIQRWLANGSWHFAVTLATNRSDISFPRMEILLRGWEARVNRALVGSRWQKPRKEKLRLRAVVVLEKAQTNPHFHLVVEFEKGARDPIRFSEVVEAAWVDLVPSGSTCVEAIYELDGWASYITKEFWLGHPNWLVLPAGVDVKAEKVTGTGKPSTRRSRRRRWRKRR